MGFVLYKSMGYRVFDAAYIEGLEPGYAMMWEPHTLQGTWLEEVEGKTKLKGQKEYLNPWIFS